MVVMEHKVKCLGNDGLQGHQPSAQGNTLGNSNRQIYNTPCKGKSFMHLRLFFWPFRPNSSLQGIVQISLVLLLLRSSFALASFPPHHTNHRALPWAKSSLAFQAV